MAERITIRLPEALLARARRKAAAEGRTLASLIEEGLRLVTAESRAPARRERTLPPISQATGGLRPGIDATKFTDSEDAGFPELKWQVPRADA